jgi:hypothetical protein
MLEENGGGTLGISSLLLAVINQSGDSRMLVRAT